MSKSASSVKSPAANNQPDNDSSGGQTTISPPAKVKTGQVLASGIDSLVLAVNIQWSNSRLFDYLNDLKNEAKQSGDDQSGIISDWPFLLKPYGARGYEWLLVGKEYSIRVGNWFNPSSRPSIMIEFRSETLWLDGPQQSVERILKILQGQGAQILSVKPSRVDLCIDFVFSEKLWSSKILEFRVTRAVDAAVYYQNKTMTGVMVGRGGIVSARLYDKFREIQTRSKKTWFFDLWGLNQEPEGMKIIRVEFQLRREALKELGIESVWNLFSLADNVWAYCTQKWLKFQDRPGNHHTMRRTLDWWRSVQNGFFGSQEPSPLIRCKAMKQDKEQIFAQAYGLLSSLAAIGLEEQGKELLARADIVEALKMFIRTNDDKRLTPGFFADQVTKKRAKYHRILDKAVEVAATRRDQNFPLGNLAHLNQTT